MENQLPRYQSGSFFWLAFCAPVAHLSSQRSHH